MKITGVDEIIIDRMEGGIPLIKAKNERDVYFGLGVCHGTDRAMQLMLMKILGSGTASKYLDASDEMLEVDQFLRRMNWSNNVSVELDKLDEKENELLQSYCDGVNSIFAQNIPWEFKYLLGVKGFVWTKKDCLLITRMVGFLTLAQSQGEIERLFVEMVQQGIKREFLEELFPNILDDYGETILKQIKLGEKIVPDAVKWNIGVAAFMASNNWVIAGNKTASGLPILACDPHLEINRLPTVWYETAIKFKESYIHGATMPGVPSVVFGRNNHLAWGVTYTFMDASDSWIEKCKDGKYLKDDKWHDFRIREEVIERKKGDSIKLVFYENEHGVLDGDPSQEGYYLCSKWSGDKSGANSIKSGFELGRGIKTVKEGMAIAGKVEGSYSWVFSDTDGNIGFQMSGLMPKRRKGITGFVPAPGWLSENDWQGSCDFKELPRSYNPPEGYIVTANNDLNHLGKVSPINMPMGDFRAKRIEQLIKKSDKHKVTDSQKIQYDTYSLQAELFMPIIKPLLPDSDVAKDLLNWDFCYDVESKGAFMFEMVYRSLFYEVFGDALGQELTEFLQNETSTFTDFYQKFDAILLAEKSLWFLGKTREEIFQKAIDTALKINPHKWGDVNQLTLTHLLLGGKMPKFFGFDIGPFSLPGGRATVHQGQIYNNAGRKTSFAPSFRLVTDMAENALYTNFIGGVSDRRFSKWYNNDFLNWKNGVFRRTEF